MCKRILALALALVMFVALLPTEVLAAESDATEPLAEEIAADGSTLSEEMPPEDAATEEVTDDGEEENVLDAPALFKVVQPLEKLAEEEAPADPEGGEAPGAGADADADAPADGADADGDLSQPEIAPISIDPDDANAEKVKNYFVSGELTGTYVTKRHTEGNSDTAWSIVIGEDGDAALYYEGEDTGATATFNSVTSSTGKPGAIVFHHDGWYADAAGETEAILTVTLNSNGYFTMPNSYHIYWDKDDTGELKDYAFSSDPCYYNETVLKEFFADLSGDYILPDGSGWKVTVGDDGDVTLSDEEGKADNAFISYIKTNASAPRAVTAITFTSPDWYNSASTSAKNYHTLTLTWTTAVNSSFAHKSFKCAAATFYDADKNVIKGFTTNCYFIAGDGIFSYAYFQDYAGTYALSESYGTVYGGDIDGIGGWKIEIDAGGHVYLCVDEEHKYEAVMTAGATTSGTQRVNTMVVALPGWYTNTSWTTPAYITLTWGYDSVNKSAGYGQGALYFTTAKQDKVYKQNEKTIVCLPALRFERSDLTAFAKSKLSPYAGEYLVSDGSDENIVIEEDGTVKLHTKDGTDLTPLSYTVDNTNWREGDEAGSNVTSVVFSKEDWFDSAKQKAPSAKRQTVAMTWDPANLQFAVSSDVTCYKPESEEVSHIYSTAIKYSKAEIIDEGNAYMKQYVHGEYTLNDGSGWKIKVDGETGKIYTKFDTDAYVEVTNPAPAFVQDTTYTGVDPNKEYGNKGKYLTTISVPVTGWYLDEGCTQDAVIDLAWNGKVVNPIDDHQFAVTGAAIYHKVGEETECKYLVGTFYSDEDRAMGEAYLADYSGTYHPTAAEGTWYIEISDKGEVSVHAVDSKNEEYIFTDVALDLTVETKHDNANLGNVKGVTGVKVVVPEWRAAQKNDTLANIAQCAETAFTFSAAANGSSFFSPAANAYLYDNADANGNPWEVKTKTSDPNNNKPLSTKLYANDRAYTDANKDAAKAYFKTHAGHYYIDEASLDYMITVTEEGQIFWGDLTSSEKPLPADVAFDAIRDDNGDGKVNEDENTIVPGTISVWLNGYTTGKVSTSSSSATYNECTARGEFTWNDTDESGVAHSAHTFKSKSSAKGHKAGESTQTNFAADKYYNIGDAVTAEDFVEPGTYETTDAQFRIEIKTDETTGETSYTFYRPDPDPKLDGYPLKLFGSGNAAYLRGFIGKMKKNDVYLVVTKGPYEGFLLTGYEVTYNDLDGKQQNSSSAPTVTLPAGTRFTNYALGDTGENKNIIVAEPGQDVDTGTAFSRLSLALHSLTGGETIYLTDDIKVGFAAKLPDGVGDVTINGQGHTITRDSFVNPNTILTDPELGDEAVMSILMDPGISLAALEDEGEAGAIPQEHYTGAILQVGKGDTVTLQNVTIDGEGQWEIDQEKLEYEKELNKSYDIDVLEDPRGGHPIRELLGNVVSTDSLIKVAGGALILEDVTLENFFAGDGYEDDRHFIDFTSTEDGKLEVTGAGAVFQHNASRSGVCIGNTDKNEIDLGGCTTMEDNYCYGGNGGLVVAMEGTQVYMDEGTKILNNVAADTNGVFVQLHKKTDGVKDGDNKGETYAKLHMNGGEIGHNVGLRGGSYGWGQTIYLYNGGAFEMNGGEIHDNIGAGISSIYQQPSADALRLNGGWIHGNTCSLTDEGTDWALDIALMNIGNVGEGMTVEQNFVVGAAAILGGYASGDEYLTNDGTIKGNISVYSYFNNEGRVSTVVNNHIIDGNIRLENGSMIKNAENGVITGNVTVRGSLTESAGESSFHNEGDIKGDIELAEGAHLYNSGEVYGNVTVKSGGTLELNCNEEGTVHGGTIHGNVTVYPDGLLYAKVSPALVDGTITLEYEDEEDLARMKEVLHDCGIQCSNIVEKQHAHSEVLDKTVIEPDDDKKCTEPWVTVYVCQTCGKEVSREETTPTGHQYYVEKVDEATCTTGPIEHIRCKLCNAYTSSTAMKIQVGDPNGHTYVENTHLYIPPTEYASGHIYYICTTCGDVLEFEIDKVHEGYTKHSFQNEDGSLKEEAGVLTPPTCTAEGEMTFTCDDCGTTITVPVPAAGHRFPRDPDEYEQIERVESGCTKEGHITYKPRCTVCGEFDTSSGAYTYTVNLPALGHDWSEWENVDSENYFCTTERLQERHCKRMDAEAEAVAEGDGDEEEARIICDDPSNATETRLGGETSHTWDEDNITCLVCGYVSTGHHISYMTNGGIAPQSLADIAGTAYKPGNTESLWRPSSDETLEGGVWTKQTINGQAVFVGWSATNLGETPCEKKPEVTFIASVVIPADADATVFAVWAADKNKNGTPDYQETPVSVFYDKNGGAGDVPAPLIDVLPGAAYPLETTPALTKGAYVFAGWSRTRYDEVIKTPLEERDIEMARSLVTSPFTVPAGVGDVTLYAVYATDADADGKPDYCKDALHVEYYINGGQVREGYTVDESGMFYVCNDYHHPGDDATLLALEYGAMMICRDGAVLIGWSAAPEDLITSEASVDGKPIKAVNLTSAESNAKVYALWAADVNHNSIADYLETTLTHTYHRNQYLSQSNASTLPAGYSLHVTKAEPPFQVDILPGTGVELAPNDYFDSADLLDDKGQVVGHYVQVGWSGYSHGACTSRIDYENWVIAGEANGYTDEDGVYYRVIYDTRFQNAFAVWASDENENGIADFKETYYTITLNINGGTGGDDFQRQSVLLDGEWFTFPADPIKAGYTFRGWSSDGGKTLRQAGDTFRVTADVTYVALYDEVAFTVTLDLNGGTAGDDFAASNPVNAGESFTFPADPTKAGYTFLGWSAEGDENLYKAGDTVTVTADVTYTAQYEAVAAPKTFQVTLDLNGGTAGEGFTTKNSVKEGESFTFPADPTKAGYTFLGWSAVGDENLYKAGDTVAVTADVTYTARYEEVAVTPKTFTVTLDLNGGTAGEGFTAKNSVKEGESFTFPADPTKEGYTFLGWSSDGGKTLYKAGDTVAVTADVTYTAQYEAVAAPKTFQVTLDLNGGTEGEGFTASTTVKEGESFTFPADPTKEGYTFLGWSAEGDETLYKAGDTVTVTADVTYTAQYEAVAAPKTFTVTLDLNGGTAGDDFATSNPVNAGESFTFPADPTKAGYTFLGWSAEGDENLYKAGDTVTVNADVTYTAQYEAVAAPKTFQVTLDLNGGTAGDDFTAKNSVKEGESFTFPADPAKAGYTFQGWSAAGDETLYKAGDTVAVTADVTYTAQYEAVAAPKTFTVTLDLNGGTAGDDFAASNPVNAGESFTFPADPTKAGYTFLGWSAEGDENLYKAGDTVTVNADVTYTARWNVRVASGSGSGRTPSPAIDRTEHYGYIIGVTAHEVRPEQDITRAEVATILFRLLTDEAREANWSETSGFPDVRSDAWYNHAVAVLHNLGIVQGDGHGSFDPDDKITRAEVAAMVVRFYEKSEGTVLVNRFTDVDETKWYTQAVLLADHYELMQGDGDQFRPEDPLTRAEAMAVFNRLLGRKPHEDHLREDMIAWTDNMDKRKWYYAEVQEATNSHTCGGDVVIDGETYETWESVEPMRDWAALER